MRVLILAIAGSLAFVTMPELAFAQWERSMPSARELLGAFLDVARRDDLSDAGQLGQRLGLRFVVEPERPILSGGQRVGTAVSILPGNHDRRIFDLDNQPLIYEISVPAGRSFKRVSFRVGIAVRNVCVTAEDFRAVFGPNVRNYGVTDFGGTGYEATIQQKNEIKISGFFGHGKCMLDLGLMQNQDRL